MENFFRIARVNFIISSTKFQSSSSIIDTLILLNHGNQISPYTIEIGKLNEGKKKENDKTDKIFSPRSSSLDEAIITYKK